MQYHFQFEDSCEYFDHPNTTIVTAKRGNRVVKVGGASLGGGLSKIFMIDDEMVDIRLSAGDDFSALARHYQPRRESFSGGFMMKIQSMKELIEACEREQKTIGEIMLMMEMEKSGRDQETIISMMEERLIKMKEAVDSGIKDASTAPSGISGGDAVKMYDYVLQGKSLSGNYISNAMSFSLATSESNARMGVIVATPTAGAAGILPGVLFSLHKNDGTSYKDLVMGCLRQVCSGL